MKDELLGKFINLSTAVKSLEGVYRALQKAHDNEKERLEMQLSMLRKSIDSRTETLGRNIKELGKLVQTAEFQMDKIASQFVHSVPEIDRKKLIEFLNKVVETAVPPLMIVEAGNSTIPTPMPGANIPITVNKESVDSTNNLAAEIEKQAREWLEKLNPPRKSIGRLTKKGKLK